jgi:hypothetical protein
MHFFALEVAGKIVPSFEALGFAVEFLDLDLLEGCGRDRDLSSLVRIRLPY